MNVRLTFMRWLPQAVFVTAICLVIYIAVQQDMRMSANDPQIQIAEDASTAATKGVSANDIAVYFGGTLSDNPNATDISQSLKPFVIVFDQSGNVLSSSAAIGGVVPTPPVGVFSYVGKNKQDRFTWQPIPQSRIAAVLVKVPESEISATSTEASIGFILAGRSLREVEIRESQLLNQVALSWIILLIVSLGYSIFISGKNGQKE